MKNAIRIMALLAAAPLAGCMLGPQPTAKSAAPAIATPQGQQTPALQTVASGLPGEVKTADDPGFGGPVSIMILSEYDAASGRRSHDAFGSEFSLAMARRLLDGLEVYDVEDGGLRVRGWCVLHGDAPAPTA